MPHEPSPRIALPVHAELLRIRLDQRPYTFPRQPVYADQLDVGARAALQVHAERLEVRVRLPAEESFDQMRRVGRMVVGEVVLPVQLDRVVGWQVRVWNGRRRWREEVAPEEDPEYLEGRVVMRKAPVKRCRAQIRCP